jgi:hypothetical protein
MNTAVTVAIWVSMGVCVVGIVLVSCWLLLDWQRDAQQARAAARMARDYGEATTEDSGLQEANEYTWPIVAQQPPVFYGNAITIPIPRSVVDVELCQRSVEEVGDFRWPAVDADELLTLGSHLKTDVLPVVHDGPSA